MEAALRELHDQPLMVLAFARPEIADSFPNLWKGLAQQIIVNPLSKRACERLVQAALAGPTAAATVARMVEQSAGNALFLEELIRAVGDGHSAAVPETILAILQARIDAQAPEARRILRAASVFGETFWLGGVRAITASESQSQDTAGWLANLERSEIIDEAPQSRFSDAEYRFRQSLMRDAAYSLLTDEDRRTGHRLAGHYLERVGESDPVVLAEHAYRGDELARAVPHFVRAAAQALASGDLILTLQRVERGLSCGAAGEARGDLLALRSAAPMWRGEFRLALDHGIDALPLLVEGSRRWCDAMLTLFYVSTYLGESELFTRFFHDFGRVEALPDAIAAYAEAGAWLAFVASFRGQRSLAQFFLTRIQAASARLDAEDPSVTGWIGYAQAIFCHWIDDDLWLKQDVARAAIAAATQAGDRRMLAFVTLALALAEMGLGDHAHGEETLERLRLMLSALSEAALVGTSMGYAALALSEVGTPEALARAYALALDCIERLPPDAPVAGSAYIGLARHFEQRGELDIAEAHARRALNLMRVIPVVSLAAHETLVRVLLARHEIAAARDRAREGLALLASLECAPSTRTALRLAAAEALHAAGDVVDAHETLRDAADGLRTAANKIPEPAARTRYFTNVWRHARILELERAWLAPTPA
ncbi:MAG: hypothetical protein JNK56_37660 [Myxococcales bacterium]|nr:hypothetical protein [Myxococcales bacterium]